MSAVKNSMVILFKEKLLFCVSNPDKCWGLLFCASHKYPGIV